MYIHPKRTAYKNDFFDFENDNELSKNERKLKVPCFRSYRVNTYS